MKISRRLRLLTAALIAAPLAGAVGCNDFLDVPDTLRDPNNQSVATRDNLLIAASVNVGSLLSGELARFSSLFAQQSAGTDRQYQGYDRYQVSEENFSFAPFYSGGGLIDLRRIQDTSVAQGDLAYAGVAKVLEALIIGTAADLFGDIPYSEALTETNTPKLDKQLDVYDALQRKLDTAITFLGTRNARSVGPRGADLFYGGNLDKWSRAAYTLKARLYVNTAEVRGNAAYQNALTAAQRGLMSPDDNLRAYASTTGNEQNLWYQFAVIQREGYISPGKFLVDLLRTRNDPRLRRYFDPNAAGQFVGAAPGEAFSATLSPFSSTRFAGGAFRQPILTAEENILIIAEAAYRLGQTDQARQALNQARTIAGLPPVAATLAGQALLTEILTEKYIALYQNIQVYVDYRRTCFPNLTPAVGREIPGRFYYPTSERSTNPNIPAPAQQPARNQADPNACT